MPNKCTVCGKVHPDEAKYLLNGCDKCGSKFFFYVREEHLKRAEREMAKLSTEEIKEIEDDIRQIIPKDISGDETVILDLEAIHVVSPGKYEIDVTNLFNQKPLVIKVGPGKYEIDLSTIISKWKDLMVVHRRQMEEGEREEEAKKNLNSPEQ